MLATTRAADQVRTQSNLENLDERALAMTVQLSWRSRYVIVDGHTYRARPKRLILAQGCEPLPMHQARWVLEEIAREDRAMLDALCTAFHIDPRTPDGSLAGELTARLGPPGRSVLSTPSEFARMYVLQRSRPKPPVRPEPVAPIQEPRSLDEIRASVSLALVDAWGNPLSDLPFELTTADGGQRSGSFGGAGEAIEPDVPPGYVEFRALEVGDDDWFIRAGPPLGWRNKGVSVLLRDASGEPIGELDLKLAFADGSSQTHKLDARGTFRSDESPSCPLRVEFPDFDPENYQ